MPIENLKSNIQSRKGIYQAFDEAGNVTGDERWRVAGTLDGGVRIDTDTTRLAPFAEPRGESFGLQLAADLAHRHLVVHALSGRREARADFEPGRASFCWRLDETSRTRDYAWAADCEIGYNSPLFLTAMLWRHPLVVGQSAELRMAQLDRVTFEPAWESLQIDYQADELHETRFGLRDMARYRVGFGARSQPGHLWCDRTGIVFDYAAPAGGGFKLVAVNFPN